MPKNIVDYQNTIIYKIYCKDKNITDVYIGHTTNFTQRKYFHKLACNNKNNKCKIYNTIRNNGGWDNWDMIEIAKYNCKNSTEARIKEQEHYDLFESTLNSYPPFVDKNKYYCNKCKKQCNSQKEFKNHLLTKNHCNKEDDDKENEETKKLKKNLPKYFCEYCNFKCYMKIDWERHIIRPKHQKLINGNILETKILKKPYKCINCEKEYITNSGLWKHKKLCDLNNNKSDDCKINNIDDTNNNSNLFQNLIIEMVKSNSDLQKNILEMCKQLQPINNTNTNINTINSNNKSFNLNLFLNETCKNAMNIMDFANSIELNLSDLEKVGELGYVEGISKIIIDNLKLLDVTERPVHCSDFKRDVLYVKDEDKWEKDNIDNAKIKKVINCVTNKNISLIPKWKKENPDCVNSNSTKSTKINKIIMESMETDKTKEEKIIKNIAKEVIINKD